MVERSRLSAIHSAAIAALVLVTIRKDCENSERTRSTMAAVASAASDRALSSASTPAWC